MAEPGSTEIVTTTLRRRRGVLTNNIENNNPVSRSMKEEGTYDMETGGRTLFEEVAYTANATVGHYAGAQTFNTAYAPTMSSIEVAWKQFGGAVTITGLEERINAGDEQSIALLKSRIQVLEWSLENFYNADMISDGTSDNGQQVGGIKYWVSSTPTSGTVGGIDRSVSANAWARNIKFDTVNDSTSGAPGGVATSAGTIKRYLTYCINQTTRGTDKVKVLLMGQSHHEMLTDSMLAIQRITSEGQKAKTGLTDLYFMGIPCYMCGGINFGGETQIATDRTYGINTRYTRMRIHKNAYMEPLPQIQSINQDAKVQLVVFMGNMTSRFPKGNFVMFDS